MASFSFGGHDRSIWVGRTDHEVSHAPIGAPNDLPVRFSSLLDPVMTLLVCLGQVLAESSFNENRKWDGGRDSGFTDRGGRHWYLAGWNCLFMDHLWRRGFSFICGEGWLPINSKLWLFFLFRGEQFSQMLLYHKARLDRLHCSIRIHFRGISVELLAPDQTGLLALADNGLKEAAKHLNTIAGTNARQARMIGKRFVQVIPHIPAHAQPISRMVHQLPFRTYTLEKHHQLQFEKHNGINRRTTTACIGLLNKLTHKGEVECSLQVSIEVILGH